MNQLNRLIPVSKDSKPKFANQADTEDRVQAAVILDRTEYHIKLRSYGVADPDCEFAVIKFGRVWLDEHSREPIVPAYVRCWDGVVIFGYLNIIKHAKSYAEDSIYFIIIAKEDYIRRLFETSDPPVMI
jgi:hypothetical protein